MTLAWLDADSYNKRPKILALRCQGLMFHLVSHGAVVTGPGEGAGVWCHDEDGGTTPPVV